MRGAGCSTWAKHRCSHRRQLLTIEAVDVGAAAEDPICPSPGYAGLSAVHVELEREAEGSHREPSGDQIGAQCPSLGRSSALVTREQAPNARLIAGTVVAAMA